LARWFISTLTRSSFKVKVKVIAQRSLSQEENAAIVVGVTSIEDVLVSKDEE